MECRRCKGRGQIPEPHYKGRDPAYITCPDCKGDGEQLGPFGTHMEYIPQDPGFYGPADLDDD